MQRISRAAYERRLGLLGCTAAAWSPLCSADELSDATADAAPCCSMLAIGTKGGRIWLWRHQLPAPSQPPTSPRLVLIVPNPLPSLLRLSLCGQHIDGILWLALGPTALLATCVVQEAGLVLTLLVLDGNQVGWVDARPCGVSQMRWHACGGADGKPRAAGAQLLLAAGATDGGVQLFHRTAAELARSAPGGVPRGGVMQRMGSPVQPDMRAVTCMAFGETCSPSPAGRGEPCDRSACLVSC